MHPSIRMLAVLLALALSTACGGSSPTQPTPVNVPYSQTDLVVGTGAAAQAGNTVIVHYIGWLYDPSRPENKGTQFDNSVARGMPLAIGLNPGSVITGWVQGVPGMRIGGARRLVLPPNLAYGAQGSPPVIPPNATLVFDIELLGIQ